MRSLTLLLILTISTRVLSNGVNLRSAPLATSTPYSRKFSSPPLSLMNSSILESGDQNWVRMGRVFSAVSGLALSSASSGATHTFMTPSRGAIQDSHLPSGLMCPAVLVGLPNILARSIKGVAGAGDAACTDAALARLTANNRRNRIGIMASSR